MAGYWSAQNLSGMLSSPLPPNVAITMSMDVTSTKAYSIIRNANCVGGSVSRTLRCWHTWITYLEKIYNLTKIEMKTLIEIANMSMNLMYITISYFCSGLNAFIERMSLFFLLCHQRLTLNHWEFNFFVCHIYNLHFCLSPHVIFGVECIILICTRSPF